MSLSPARERMARAALARYLGPVAASRATITPLGDGLINETFLVQGDHSALPDDGLPAPTRSVLQRVNPLFDIVVHEDIEAITRHLARRGLPTLRLYRASEGELAVEIDGQVPVEVQVDVPHMVAPGESLDDGAAAEEPGEEGGVVSEDLASTGSQPTLFPEDEDTSEIWIPKDEDEDDREGRIGPAVDDRTGEVPVPQAEPADGDERTGEVEAPHPEDERTGEVAVPEHQEPEKTSEVEVAARGAAVDSRPAVGDRESRLAVGDRESRLGSAVDDPSPLGTRVRWERTTRTELRPDRGVYRLCSFVPGRTVSSVAAGGGAQVAREAGRLVGRFHEALLDLQHDFAFTRPGAHHLPTHLNTLLLARESGAELPGFEELADEICERISEHPPEAPGPRRLCHGDLKISNLRFDDAGRGLCLLDLDTLGYLPLVVELGDALRSWCNGNPAAEDSPDGVFDVEIFAAALSGYAERARAFLQPEERAGLVAGVERIALELAARFAADVVNDRYFGWSSDKFPSRRDHNLVRAQGQLNLARSISAQRAAAEAAVSRWLS